MAKEVNRRFDLAAFAAIIEHAQENGSVTLEFESEKAAEGVRLQFYRWRSQEQKLNADPTFLAGFVARITENKLTITAGLGNTDLRLALAKAGVKIEEGDELPELGS